MSLTADLKYEICSASLKFSQEIFKWSWNASAGKSIPATQPRRVMWSSGLHFSGLRLCGCISINQLVSLITGNWWIVVEHLSYSVWSEAPPTVSEIPLARRAGRAGIRCQALSSRSPIKASQPSSRSMCLQIQLLHMKASHPVRSAQSDHHVENSLVLQPGSVSERRYWSKPSDVSRPLSPSALLKPKEPNNNKHLCCYCLSLSD